MEEISPQLIRAARSARLRYISDQTRGIRRERVGKSFSYFDPKGRKLRDPGVLQRIRSIAIPPAWREVWISPSADTHLQATGRDLRGRKQFRYHTQWREVRDASKYHRTLAFAEALARIRERVARDIARPGIGRAKVLATMVRLLETTHIRVGNEEYLRHNRSIGLSTMRERHARVSGSHIRFVFRGKSGKWHDQGINDPQLARIVRQLQDLPGQVLFQYVESDGRRRTIHSHDINSYLREIAGDDFSAKDFRTWSGTVMAAVELSRHPRAISASETKVQLVATIQKVARRLGNTPAVCRQCYIHPAIIEGFTRGHVVRISAPSSSGRGSLSQQIMERRVLRFLNRHVHRNLKG